MKLFLLTILILGVLLSLSAANPQENHDDYDGVKAMPSHPRLMVRRSEPLVEHQHTKDEAGHKICCG